jgi:hypothetical protein
MRAASRLLASTDAMKPNLLRRERPLALLPAIPLYRRILRVHRKLPAEERILGDMYVKAEFRAHREVDNPVHIIGFLSEWQSYLQMIEGDSWRGGKLDKQKLDKMSGKESQRLIVVYI